MGAQSLGLSPYPAIWSGFEQVRPYPERYTGIAVMTWQEFRDKAMSGDVAFAEYVVHSLYKGRAFLLRGAFSREFMASLKANTAQWTRRSPPSFHKMLEGSPDFHRVIDLETGRKYSFRCCKHSAYFYRWNDDPLGIWADVTERWRVIKLIMGLSPDAYEKNTPKDGVVDRIQVVRYPPSIGFLEPHQDPHLHQRVFLSGYMSRRGVDFHGGGFYFIGRNDEVVDIEPMFEVGDICIACATVMHGVAPCDRGKAPDWSADDGRWFLSMYSNASDEVPNRHTGHPVKLEIPAVMP